MPPPPRLWIPVHIDLIVEYADIISYRDDPQINSLEDGMGAPCEDIFFPHRGKVHEDENFRSKSKVYAKFLRPLTGKNTFERLFVDTEKSLQEDVGGRKEGCKEFVTARQSRRAIAKY